MLKISVVINTYNAEQHLEKVLESVINFDEIIICDMYSTDQTLSIAQKFNCKIVMHEKASIVEPARLFAISQAKNDWVLVVDADEVVQEGLQQYLSDSVSKIRNLGGIYIPRKNYIFGKFVTCSYPDYLLRFLRKEGLSWSSTIHSTPRVEGQILKIPKKRQDLAFIHLANESMSQISQKNDKYSDLEVVRRMHKKYNYASLIIEPFLRFFKLYIIKGGIFDGIPGLIFSMHAAFYKFLTISKVIEAKIDPKNYDKDLLKK